MTKLKKPAILLVGNYSNRTGYAWNNIYRLFNFIAGSMQQQGVSVCLSFAELEPPVEFMDKNIAYECFQFDPYNLTLSSLVSLSREIKKHNVKYVYFTDLRIFHWLYVFLRILGVNKIIVHSRVSVKDPYPVAPEKGLRRHLKTAIGKNSWVTPNKVYAVSDFVRNRIIHKNCFDAKKVIKILNGINISKFNCAEKNTATEKVRIFIGGRANEHKGIDILIKATSILVDAHRIKGFKIEYAGDGPELNNLKNMVHKLHLEKYFIFLGQLPDTLEVICQSDIVVVPSTWGDACPSAVSEALAAGKALITTSAGGIPELVGDDTNAVVIPPLDEKTLADALAKLVLNHDLRIQLGVSARVRAEAALDEKDYYATFIQQLISDLEIALMYNKVN